MDARVTYDEISLEEWQHRYLEFFKPNIPLFN
jgi:hypothetical protein